ncbi:hypothetical protein COL922a_007723 [Colletotrichum nupharicola]|nr:hypothetical protein COL922a_007723 [Colletotrichum nupharicola]
MTQFKFRPLEEADVIRLLVLYPSHETTAPLSGSLINTTLSACDSDFANGYLALSYRIWADALCINQSDTAEKNRQVPLMGNIYSLAKTTVIYLGPLSPGIETIFKAVHDSKPGFVTVDAAGDSRIALAKDLQQLEKFDVKAGSEPPAAAIDELLQRPWFTRVWVAQELLLSRDAWVQCGALRVRWRELGALLVPILDRTKGEGSTALQQTQSLNLEEEKKDIKDRERANYLRKVRKASEELTPSLSHILRMRQGCRASDPRDMIFGYMGMHADRDEVAEFLTVDYEMPLRQLLISTARAAYALNHFNRAAWKELLETENLSFWRDLDIRSSETQDPSPIRLFPDSFWDLAAEDDKEYPRLKYTGMEATSQKAKVASRALQTLSFFMAYVGGEVMSATAYGDEYHNALQWDLYEGQRIRLALSTAGFILAVPAYVEVGDVFMRLDSLTASYGSEINKNHCFGGLLRPLAKDTGDPLVRAFKWLCCGGVPVWRDVPGYRWKFTLLPTEVDNNGLKRYDDKYPKSFGKLKYIELC